MLNKCYWVILFTNLNNWRYWKLVYLLFLLKFSPTYTTAHLRLPNCTWRNPAYIWRLRLVSSSSIKFLHSHLPKNLKILGWPLNCVAAKYLELKGASKIGSLYILKVFLAPSFLSRTSLLTLQSATPVSFSIYKMPLSYGLLSSS